MRCWRTPTSRPGGRLSIFEPINRFGRSADGRRFLGYETGPVEEVIAKVRRVFERLQPPDTDPMMDFD